MRRKPDPEWADFCGLGSRALLERYKRQATLLNYDPHADIEYLKTRHERDWKPMLGDMLRAGELMAAGEGNLYVETRRPYVQTGNFALVTQTTTSKNWLPQVGTGFMTPASYWDAGKEIRYTIMGKMTTGATPGNQTIELRYQAAQPLTDAGGTILSTSTAIAAGANKTDISFVMMGRYHSRAAISTASAMFAWGVFMPNQLSVLLPAANVPLIIPETAPASANVDTTLAGGCSVQGKNSGANASTVTILDLSVEATT